MVIVECIEMAKAGDKANDGSIVNGRLPDSWVSAMKVELVSVICWYSSERNSLVCISKPAVTSIS
jgi:hypothetical protein